MKAGFPNVSLTEQLINRCDCAIDATTRRRAAVHLLDWLGCALAGQNTDTGLSLGRYAQKYCHSGPAFNATGSSLCALDAAFVNGGLGNILEMDDLHRQSLLHTSDTVIPAALAVAQDLDVGMDQLLDAIVKGYEVAIHIGKLAASNGYSAWYISSTCGVFGAAMATSHLYQLTADETADSLAQCGMMASGLWQCRLEPGSSKQVATASAARNGVMAALLASEKLSGPKFILDGELGFFKTLYPAVTVPDIDLQVSNHWMINEVSFKPWAACRHTHPAIEAALSLAEHTRLDDIESIVIGSYNSGLTFCDNPNPKTDHEARFSLQYCVATALVRGSPKITHFEHQQRNDTQVQSLIGCTQLSEDEQLQKSFPDLLGGRVTVNCKGVSAQTKLVVSALGDPENPMSIDAIRKKFSDLCTAVGIACHTSDQLIEQLTHSDTLASLSDLNNSLGEIETQLEECRYGA